MTDKPENPPAFPLIHLQLGQKPDGMSLRDYFAGQALSGLVANSRRDGTYNAFARDAYDYADAMLAEREKRDE